MVIFVQGRKRLELKACCHVNIAILIDHLVSLLRDTSGAKFQLSNPIIPEINGLIL